MRFAMIMWNWNMKKKQKCYTDTGSVVYTKAGDICKYFSKDIEERFDTSKYELDKPLAKGKINKVVGLKEDKWVGKSWKNLTKKDTKKCVLKRKLKFEDRKIVLK